MFDYESYYEQMAEIFNDIRLDKQKEISTTLSIIERYVNISSKILDIGCGTGRYAYALKKQGYEVMGVDKSESQVLQARRQISAIQGNVINLPFEKDRFDACVMIMVIQQLTERELDLALNEIKRILRNNGILIIKTCSTDDLKKRFSNRYFPSALELNLKRYHSIPDLEKKITKLGYEFINILETRVIEPINSDKWIFSVEKKHNSTLALLNEDEFQRGLAIIRREYSISKEMEKIHYHTYIIAKNKKGFT